MNDVAQEGRLVRIEEKLDYLSQRLEEVVITQLRDHGKRLSSLESAEARRVGAMAVIAFMAATFGGFIVKMM